MRFSTRAQVDAPPEAACAAFADFPRLVRIAEARGATVQTRDAAVFACRLRFDWNGTARELAVDVTCFDPPRGYAAALAAGGLAGTVEIAVTPRDADRSQVRVTLELRPVTLAGRILLQPLKLVKGRLDDRFAARIAEFAAGIGRTA